jgi:hypothetical protein
MIPDLSRDLSALTLYRGTMVLRDVWNGLTQGQKNTPEDRHSLLCNYEVILGNIAEKQFLIKEERN